VTGPKPIPLPDAPGLDAPAADDPLSETLARPRPSPTHHQPSGPKPSLIRSSMVVSSLTMVSRLLGFMRDLAISYTMGASFSPAADAYNTALAFPNLFRRIFAEGAFAAAFVPAYSKALAKDGEEVADVLAGDAMAVLAAATIVITVVAQLTMPWLMYLINPGYAHDPVKFKLAVLLTQIAMPYLPCMAIYAHLSGVLNARGRFVVYALAPSLLNVGMLLAVLPQHDARGAAIAASWGVLGAGVAQVALLTWGVKKSGAAVHWSLPRLTPDVKMLIGKAIPGAAAASATQINIFISGILASQTPGARSWLAVADRLYQLPLGLVGVAMGVALLPRLSQAVQAKDHAGGQAAMDEAIGFSLALTLPAAAALIAMPFFLIDGMFTRGQFHVIDAQNTAHALFWYGVGTPAFVLQQLFSRAFFARGDTKTPMKFAMVSVVVNIVAGLLLFKLIGFAGIAAATAVASWLNVTMMAATLQLQDHYSPSWETIVRLRKLIAASAIMGVVMALASWLRPHFQHFLLRKEIAVGFTVIVGAAVYVALLFALKAVSRAEIRAALKRTPKAKGGSPAPEELG
jgi:putative peptidoglycan lipid II flippase